ncbi:MAG: hypothetical protein FWF51_09495 [Chitinivibrionia bacterium]|nr:hypothetical protein [Chitinivibrionia bacterium]
MDLYDSKPKKNDGSRDAENSARPFLGVHFECCDMYVRLYRPIERPFYQGRCPKCGKPVFIPVGEGGTSSRFFSVR